MEYTKTVWKDLPDTSTPITADRLNNLENGVGYLFENGTGGGDNLPVGVEMDFDGVSQDIPTGWESVTNPDSYSTSEVKTNMTWIDGKPIYKRTFTGNSGAARTNATVTIAENQTIDVLISAEGVYQNKTASSQSYQAFGSDTSALVYDTAGSSANNVIFFINNSSSASFDYYITLYYTKTTD